MRVICGFGAVLLLAVLSQPALAVCINRGGAVDCKQEPKKAKHFTKDSDEEVAAGNPQTNGQTIVLQPSSPDKGAWVLTPEVAVGATVESVPGAASTTAACVSC